MGFTFSHPALILPCKYFPRRTYSVSGLAVGSMIPDLEYFIRIDNSSSFSHTLLGLFLFCLPAAILILISYHQLIRDAFIRNLPAFFKSRLSGFMEANWLLYLKNNWVIVSYSILIGAFTHLLWDNFTSGSGFFVLGNSILKMKVNVLGIQYYNYKILKHVSSLIGIAALIYVLLKLPKRIVHTKKRDKNYWYIIFVLFSIFLVMQLVTYSYHISFNNFIKKGISSGLLATAITSLCYWEPLVKSKMN